MFSRLSVPLLLALASFVQCSSPASGADIVQSHVMSDGRTVEILLDRSLEKKGADKITAPSGLVLYAPAAEYEMSRFTLVISGHAKPGQNLWAKTTGKIVAPSDNRRDFALFDLATYGDTIYILYRTDMKVYVDAIAAPAGSDGKLLYSVLIAEEHLDRLYGGTVAPQDGRAIVLLQTSTSLCDLWQITPDGVLQGIALTKDEKGVQIRAISPPATQPSN